MFRILGKSKIAFVLAILFGISLLFFKSGSRYSNFFNSDSIVANVSNTSISTTKFNRTMKMNIDNFNQMLGKTMTGDEIRQFQIPALALNALINDAVFEDEYEKINLTIDEKVIAQKTKDRIPQLYDSNNKLNELYLKTFLQQQQLVIDDLVQIINFETRDEYFSSAFFDINFPKYFTKQIQNFDNQERKISYIKIPLNEVSIDEILQEYSSTIPDELQKFYNENIKNYMSKEKRDVEFFIIDKKEYTSTFTPSDFEIEEFYNSNMDFYFQNEKRSFVQFNFKTTEEAQKFQSKISSILNASGISNLSNLLEFAKKTNVTFNEFDDLEKNEILDQISNPLFKLLPNKKSDIIESPLSKHILILKSIKPSYQLKIKEVENEISKTIKNIESDNYVSELSNQISEKILNGSSFNDIASSLNLKTQSIKNLTRDYNDYDQSEKIFFSNLKKSSFKSNSDFVSDLIKIDEGLSYVFNVISITLANPIELNQVKDRVLKDWEYTKRLEKIQLDAQKNINNDLFISNLSKKYNIKIIEELIVSKDSNKIPRNLINNIFNSAKNKNVLNVFEDILYIAKIEDVIIPDSDISELISLNSDLRSSFGQELMKNKKIKTNDNLINALLDQY